MRKKDNKKIMRILKDSGMYGYLLHGLRQGNEHAKMLYKDMLFYCCDLDRQYYALYRFIYTNNYFQYWHVYDGMHNMAKPSDEQLIQCIKCYIAILTILQKVKKGHFAWVREAGENTYDEISSILNRMYSFRQCTEVADQINRFIPIFKLILGEYKKNFNKK